MSMLRDWYREPIMEELRQNPEKYLQVILDIAISSIAREKSTEKILWLAKKVGLEISEGIK